MCETFEMLRIIASESKGLPSGDRAILRQAADEMEQHLKLLVSTQDHLIQANQQRIALTERLLHFKGCLPKFSIDEGTLHLTYSGTNDNGLGAL